MLFFMNLFMTRGKIILKQIVVSLDADCVQQIIYCQHNEV